LLSKTQKGTAVTIRVGVMGVGNIGSDHVNRLARQVVGSRVAAVFDVDAARAKEIGAAVGAVAHPSASQVIQDPDVDAVVIASPGELHAEQVLACIDARKPVLCEKPLATTATDALRVLAAEAALGRRLVTVGFMRRYDRGYRAVKATMESGSIGEPLIVHCVHRNAVVPDTFTGEMSLTDSVVHEIDINRWLLGQEIAATTVLAVKRSPLAAAHLRDPQLVLLEFADGAVVEIESFVNCQYGYDVRCEVVGSLGTATLENPTSSTLVRNGQRIEAVPADWRMRFGQAYVDELQDWIAGVATGTAVGASAWDGYAATAVAESAVAAYTRGTRTEVVMVDRPALYG
jgi:myo-inositol 2-dehydrogenase/D-chiro-inositol 1-dehydrogenase